MTEKELKSVQEEPKQVSRGRKRKEEVQEPIMESKEISQEPKPKVLTPHEIEKVRRLAGEIQLADKDVQLVDDELKVEDYEIKLKERDIQLITKTIETMKAKKELVNKKRLEKVGIKRIREKAYLDFSISISKKYDIEFSKCQFDPETGMIELVGS